MQSMKETASNVAASAKAGMEKTKATMEEKAEKMKTRDPLEKEMATEKKGERIAAAEMEKQQVRDHNAAARQMNQAAGGATGGAGVGFTTGDFDAGTGYGTGQGYGYETHTYSTTGAPGVPTGAHQRSAMPGHGTGQPMGGNVVDDTERVRPGHRTGGATDLGAGGNY